MARRKGLTVRLVKLGGSLAVAAADLAWNLLLKAAGRKVPGRCVILTYHRVTPGQLQCFTSQMDRLLRRAQPLPAGGRHELEPGKRYAVVTFDDGFAETMTCVEPQLVKYGIPYAVFVPSARLGEIADWGELRGRGGSSTRVMTAEELAALARSPLATIGSHGRTHEPLTGLAADKAKQEINVSRTELEEILGKDVTLFSFPHGAVSGEHLAWARERGYERVFTIVPRPVSFDAEEFVAGRFDADPEDWPLELELKLRGAYRWLAPVSALKRRLTGGAVRPGAAGEFPAEPAERCLHD